MAGAVGLSPKKAPDAETVGDEYAGTVTNTNFDTWPPSAPFYRTRMCITNSEDDSNLRVLICAGRLFQVQHDLFLLGVGTVLDFRELACYRCVMWMCIVVGGRRRMLNGTSRYHHMAQIHLFWMLAPIEPHPPMCAIAGRSGLSSGQILPSLHWRAANPLEGYVNPCRE